VVATLVRGRLQKPGNPTASRIQKAPEIEFNIGAQDTMIV